ncbi:MAG: hypothetical protein IKP31_01375, partial [Lachnospiraceae bacterium]|nr:hypothetical protein [Lachnospiraceae bacterium]
LHGITVTKVPGSVDVVVSFENADPRAKVYLVAAYKEHENVSYVAIGKCLVDVKITGTVEDLEAHLTQKSLKIEVYKKNNVLPVTIRMSDAGRSGETPDFNITEVSFDSKYSMLNNYFNISVNPVNEEKCNLVIIANEDAINDDSVVDMFKSYKKGISTNLNLNVTDGKNSTILTTLEKVTFTFGDEKPTAKTVKAGTTLTFDSWFSNNSWSPYDIDELNITGANVGWMAIPDVAKDAKAWANLGLAIRYYDGEEIIYSTPNMLKKGSGKINLVVGIEDSSYNLPDNYNITIPVSYSITDSTPTLKPDKTTVNINKDAGDRVPINFTYSGSRNYNTKIEVTDSTGKKVYNEANTPINYTSSRDYSGNLILTLYPTGKAERNNNYKVKVTAKSPYNSKKVSATKVITVKVLKAGAQMSISSVSAKGSIDASLSNSYIYLTFTGKNVDLDWRTATCNITLKDKTKKDITSEYFGAGAYYDSYGKTVGYIRCYSGAKLLKDGYAGKKATATFTFDVEGTQLNKTYDFTIGNSKVTPKLCTDKVTLNPVYDNSTNVTFYLKNEFANNYKYNVTILDKNKKSADDLFDVTMDISSSPVYIKVTPKNISKLAGQTYTMKITPYWEYDGELVPLKTGTATATIAVLKKPDVTISAKTNGSIDVVRDNTCVGIDLTYKNMYIDPYHAFDNATINITDSKGNDVTNKFDWEIYSPYYGYIYRGEGVDNITAGTYKATIKLISEEYPSVETTASFKVTRGSTGTKLNPKSVTLVNRDYSRSYIVNIDRASDVNQITNVTLGDAFKDVFVLSKHGSMDKWRVKVKYGYVERTNKGVPITKAVKKTVPINVYYNGSLKPDTVKLTVTIEP